MKVNLKFIFLLIAFGRTFLFFFWRVCKFSDQKGFRRFRISVKITNFLIFASFGLTATPNGTDQV